VVDICILTREKERNDKKNEYENEPEDGGEAFRPTMRKEGRHRFEYLFFPFQIETSSTKL
jgi:hypothetical protein